MHHNLEDDADDELVPIPMDRETRARLVKLSIVTGAKPSRLAASLLRDVLREDELFNAPAPPARTH